ncbi:MAG: lytic transglycosylase domain-containing protein [Sphingobacteriia bacterium]|nr:lytic transglycosylase domain-containing protein [Sphingobacteriia bacterium]
MIKQIVLFILLLSKVAIADTESTYNIIINASKTKNWSLIKKQINTLTNQDTKAFAEWLYVRDSKSGASFEEIASFLEKHPHFPEHKSVIENAENALSFKVKKESIAKWCKNHLPNTGTSQRVCNIHFAEILKDSKDKAIYLRKAWIYGDFKPEEENDFLNKYSKYLIKGDNLERAQRLIWEEKTTQLKRLQPKLSTNSRALVDNILKLKSGKLIALPQEHSKNPLAIYYLIKIYNSKKKDDHVDDLIIQAGHNVPYPDKWALIRKIRAREAITHKNYKLAYNLIKNHNLKAGKDFADSEWLAGWIALTYLHDANTAIKHFTNLHEGVKYSMSKVRAAYWLGMAYRKLNDEEHSNHWLKEASKHPEMFYGQVALLKLGIKHYHLPHSPKIEELDRQNILKRQHYRIATVLLKAKDPWLAKKFLTSAIHNTKDRKESYLYAKLPLNINSNLYKSLSVSLSKEAAQFGNLFVDIGYPKIKKDNYLVEHALIMSVIRQESNFHQHAKSSAGALGLMQLLPTTAKELAKKVGLQYNLKKITADPNYNVMLGQYYLHRLMNNYDSNVYLTLMAYNAGGGNVKKWLNNMGNPTSLRRVDDIINWIESIPWAQPRDYVHTILGNLSIYRGLVNPVQKTHQVRIHEDLIVN